MLSGVRIGLRVHGHWRCELVRMGKRDKVHCGRLAEACRGRVVNGVVQWMEGVRLSENLCRGGVAHACKRCIAGIGLIVIGLGMELCRGRVVHVCRVLKLGCIRIGLGRQHRGIELIGVMVGHCILSVWIVVLRLYGIGRERIQRAILNNASYRGINSTSM